MKKSFVFILNLINPFHSLTFYYFKIHHFFFHLGSGFPSYLFPSDVPTKLFIHLFSAPCGKVLKQRHHPLFRHNNDVHLRTQITEHIMPDVQAETVAKYLTARC
jgi:hypothetical protein